MAVNFNIPAITGVKAYKDTEVPLIKKNIASMYAKHKKTIDAAAIYNKLPKELINGFIFIESSGKEDAVSSAGAVGLMQLTQQTANDVVRRDMQKKWFTNAEKNILVKYIGVEKANKLMASKIGDTTVYITKEDLKKPELNIMLGTAYLGQIVDKLNTEKDLRLDKAIILYNRGFYTNIKNLKGGYADVMATQPTETKNYILKLVAQNGVLDIIL